MGPTTHCITEAVIYFIFHGNFTLVVVFHAKLFKGSLYQKICKHSLHNFAGNPLIIGVYLLFLFVSTFQSSYFSFQSLFQLKLNYQACKSKLSTTIISKTLYFNAYIRLVVRALERVFVKFCINCYQIMQEQNELHHH